MIRSIVTGNYQNAALCLLPLNLFLLPALVQDKMNVGVVVEGGYLDIGILDTMKDLLVNLLGATVFSIIGYITVKYSKDSKIANNYIIRKKNRSV